MVNCPNCKKENSNEATFCIECGTKMKGEQKQKNTKKRPIKPGCLIFIVIFAVLGLLYYIGSNYNTDAGSNNANNKHKVEYTVNCSPNGFSVTYFTNGSTMEQKKVNGNTFHSSFNGKPGDPISLNAQADNVNATISATIKYNGKVTKKGTSTGDYVLVQVSDIIPY